MYAKLHINSKNQLLNHHTFGGAAYGGPPQNVPNLFPGKNFLLNPKSQI